jgi:hypothetical protein
MPVTLACPVNHSLMVSKIIKPTPRYGRSSLGLFTTVSCKAMSVPEFKASLYDIYPIDYL